MFAKDRVVEVAGSEKMTAEEKIAVMSEPASEAKGNKDYEKDEDIDWDNASEDGGKKEAAEVKAEVKVEPVVEKKEELLPVQTNAFDKLERELAKEEGKEDLKDFSPTEKAYYHQMRRDRKQRQKAEKELEEARFANMQLKMAKDKPVVEEVEEEDIFKDRPLDDLLTVEDMKKYLAKEKKPKKEEPVVEIKQESQLNTADPLTKKFLDLCEKEAKSSYSDYEEVVELSKEIISNNSSYLEDLARCMQKGDNPAIRMYEIIKSDAEFVNLFPVAQTRVKARKGITDKPAHAETIDVEKEKKAKEVQTALENNKAKTKTSAHAAGTEDTQSGELVEDEIAIMVRTNPKAFWKLPKKQRDMILKKYG